VPKITHDQFRSAAEKLGGTNYSTYWGTDYFTHNSFKVSVIRFQIENKLNIFIDVYFQQEKIHCNVGNIGSLRSANISQVEDIDKITHIFQVVRFLLSEDFWKGPK
jgi:hypothetical protein